MKSKNTLQWNNRPDKPGWFENLEKARQVRHNNLEDAPTAREALYEPDLWFDHCEKTGKTNTPKVGRPKLPPEKLKRNPMLRNQEVRLMLAERGITIDNENSVILSNGNTLFGFKFLKNGRVCDSEGITMSAHQMLQLI